MQGSYADFYMLVGDGRFLPVDVLAYPEDTFLIMDPYSEIEPVDDSFREIIARAEETLPRDLGEVILHKNTHHLFAERLAPMVLFDLDTDPPLGERALISCGENLAQILLAAGPRSLGFDRFGMLARWISEAKILKCLLGPISSIATVERIFFSVETLPLAKRFKMAHENLFRLH